MSRPPHWHAEHPDQAPLPLPRPDPQRLRPA